MNEVTAARREGDRDSSQSVMATLMKLIGKVAYGSLIMNKEAFRNRICRQREEGRCNG